MKTQSNSLSANISNKISYYENELSYIDTKAECAPTIKIVDAYGNKTKCININKESAEVLIAWLKNNFK